MAKGIAAAASRPAPTISPTLTRLHRGSQTSSGVSARGTRRTGVGSPGALATLAATEGEGAAAGLAALASACATPALPKTIANAQTSSGKGGRMGRC